ncbi:hypothetical protein HPB47_004691 [Ixodes persulcatus]|uniref:Uncharacterized protein n=1 Tax=Ixodes persulcatus TaxID=34615 RepID=A0AC60PF75_IXOPE|nr:hypothetical protein HPB47_004691 [Ixodes persulcatus]
MTSEKFLEWLERIWGPNVDDVRQLLVLDQAPIHKTQAAKDTIQERNTNLVYVLAGCTSLPQPGDVFWNMPLKASLRRTWEAFMRKEEKTAEETCEIFPGRTCSISSTRRGLPSQKKPWHIRSEAAASQTRSTIQGGQSPRAARWHRHRRPRDETLLN